MASSVVLRRVALVRTNVSEGLSASFIRVTRIGELGTTLRFSGKSGASARLYAVALQLIASVVVVLLYLLFCNRIMS
jgi:hypothetical protein